MVRGLIRGVNSGLVPAVLLVGVLSGCSSESEPDSPADGGKASAKPAAKGESPAAQGEGTPVAKQAGTVGGTGSPCALPVSFDLAAGWKPQAVKDDPTFGLTKQGPVTLVCEIDAKPAGNIGFIRVWTEAAGHTDPRAALEAFVAKETASRDKVAYTQTKAGQFAATEVTYVNTDEVLDAPKNERAFALKTPKGLVVVHLGGLDNEEHKGMLPAYELAKKSVRAA